MNLATDRTTDASKLADKMPALPPEVDDSAAPDQFFIATPKVFAPGLEPDEKNADEANIPSSRKGH